MTRTKNLDKTVRGSVHVYVNESVHSSKKNQFQRAARPRIWIVLEKGANGVWGERSESSPEKVETKTKNSFNLFPEFLASQTLLL